MISFSFSMTRYYTFGGIGKTPMLATMNKRDSIDNSYAGK